MFCKSQAGLKAIDERLKTAGSVSADAIAREIQRDLERVLGKKTAVGMSLGGLATTCGSLCGVPALFAILGGVAAVVNMSGSVVSKRVD